MPGSAGNLKFTVEFDNRAAGVGVKQTQRIIDRFAQSVQNMGGRLKDSLSSVFGVKSSELNSQLDKTQMQIDKSKRKLQELSGEYDKLISGESEPKSVRQLQKELTAATNNLDKMNNAIVAQEDKVNQLDFGKNTKELENAKQELVRMEREMDEAGNAADKLRQTLKNLKTNPGATEEAKKISAAMSDERKNLEVLNKKYDEQKKKAKDAYAKAQAGAKKSEKSTSLFGAALSGATRRIGRLAAAALIFNVIRKALNSLQKYMSSLVRTDATFVNSLAEIKGNLQGVATPIFAYLMPALNALARGLATVTAYMAQFSAALFGMSGSKLKSKTKALNQQAAAIKKTGEAAKDALAPWDELNVLEQDSSSGSGAGVSYEGLSAPDMSFLDYINSIDWNGITKKVIRSVTGIVNGVLKKLPDFITAGRKIITGIFTGIADSVPVLLTAIPLIVDALDAAIDNAILSLKDLVPAAGTILQGAITAGFLLMRGLAESIRDALPQLVATIPLIVQTFVDFLIMSFNLINEVGPDIITALIAGITASVAMLATVAPLIVDSLVVFITDNLPILMASGLNLIITIAEAILANLPAILDAGIKILLALVDGLIATLPTLLEVGMQALMDLIIVLIQLSPDLVECGIKLLVALIKGLIEAAPRLIRLAVSLVGGMASALLSAVPTLLTAVGKMVSKVLDKLKNAGSGMGKAISDWFAGIPNTIKNALNSVIDKINTVSARISDKLSFSLPFDLGDFSITIPRIPRLAQGAVIPANREFLAVLGDQKSGTNIEAPLSTIEQALENVLSRRSTEGSKVIVLKVDKREFGRVCIDAANLENSRVGVRMVKAR
ncbi:MAG: hypothetical protein Q4A45_03350 [Clostridia bacterium]|nr:hypothetical protein [Clostridia bacterium]